MTLVPIDENVPAERDEYDVSAAIGAYRLEEGGIEPGDYDSYVGLIDRATLQRMNSPDDFFAEANFPSAEYGDVTLGYYEMGMEQLFARCNNREAELAYLNGALEFIDLCEEEGKVVKGDSAKGISIVIKSELTMRRRRGDEEWKAGIADMGADLELRLETLIAGINEDKRAGVYRDYTAVRKRWQEAMAKKESIMGAAVGDLVQDMPPFFQMAVAMARRTESNTRRTHIQSLMARVTENVSNFFDFRMAQRSMGGMRGRGRRGRGGPASFGSDE